MIKATQIQMHTGKEESYEVTEIESIYLTGVKSEKFYKKENVYDFIEKNPNNPICVDISPNPKLVAAKTKNGEKYVRSAPNDTPEDNLLKLPRV